MILRLRAVFPFLFLLLFSAILGISLTVIDQGDIRSYRSILESSLPAPEESQETHSGKQKRWNVHKTVLVSEESGRMMMVVEGKESELAFTEVDDRLKVVETLTDVECDMQEELYYLLPDGKEGVRNSSGVITVKDAPSTELGQSYDPYDPRVTPYQRIRHLEADQAIYDYEKDLFIAERVDLDRYQTEGHVLPRGNIGKTPLMKGFASSVQFSVGKQAIWFRAHHLKAKLYSEGGLF